MDKKLEIRRLIFIIIAVNAAGFLLKYFELDNYVIIIGFRFHLSFILPLLIYFRKEDIPQIKKIFADPEHKKTILPLLWILLPLILIIIPLYLLGKLQIGDPDYFYEFGLSSIVDYPVYLLWNLPQAIVLFLFLATAVSSTDHKIKVSALILFLVFIYEFIPFEIKSFNYFPLVSLLLISISTGILIKYFQNIYWLSIFLFSIFWIHFLLFGTDSEKFIHLLFASRYYSWEGFLDFKKELAQYLLPAQLLLTFITIMLSSLIRNRKIGRRILAEN